MEKIANHKDIPGNPSTAKSSKLTLNKRSNGEPLNFLSSDQWDFWLENGYVIIKSAVSKNQAKKTASFLWEFEEKDPKNKDTWYTLPRAEMKMKELAGTGMVEVYNHQFLWENRQSEKIYKAFIDIWGTKDLWVTIDRANLNFPLHEDHDYKGFIHWDYDPSTNPQNVQGVLALSDQMDQNMGGFQCIPWLYRNFDKWIIDQKKGYNPFIPDIRGLEDKIVKVGLELGDMLIFNSLLPHGIRPNLTKSSGSKVSTIEARDDCVSLTAAPNPMPDLSVRCLITSSIPENAPPQIKSIFEVSICINSCWGCFLPP